MNYIQEILAFQGFAQDHSLSSGQIALWYALMYINNRSQWQEWFTVANKSLESNSGLSRQGILKARNHLKQLGLIDYRSYRTYATVYKMCPLSKSVQGSVQDSVQGSIQDGIQDGVQDGVQGSCTLINKTKQNKTKQMFVCAQGDTTKKKSRRVTERESSIDLTLFEGLGILSDSDIPPIP